MFKRVNIISGGFPCQDVSHCGDGTGLEGERSGLWRFMLSAIRLVRPQHVVVENVAALLDRGMGTVLGDLAESGYDAEWDCLPACEFGAPHQRDRAFIVADSAGQRQSGPRTYRQPLHNSPREFGEADELVDAVQGKSLPYVCRRHDGISRQMDRMHALGNAVVPQIAEWIGRRIVEAAK